MIDIHAHILPGLDDGPQHLDDAVAMAQLAADTGTTVVFATPHIATHQALMNAPAIPARVADLQQTIDAAHIPLRLIPGAEVFPMGDMLGAIDDGMPITLGGGKHYLLIDCPFTMIPVGFEQLLYALQVRRITPILAHPERVAPFQENPQLLEPLVQRGILLQINTSSILGRHGEVARQTAHTLLRSQWVHFLASDSHSPRKRRPILSSAVEILGKTYPAEMIEACVRDNGMRVMNDEPVPSYPLPYKPVRKKRGWFG